MKKIYLLCEPKHTNLGDQAQLMCTLNWLKENYPHHRIVRFGYMFGVFDFNMKSRLKDMLLLFKYLYLKLTIRKEDFFVGHSGYLFVDHHIGWATFSFITKYFPNQKIIILPQTINFYSPVAKQIAARSFGDKNNLMLLCRDNVSYENAKQLFGNTKLLLFPDIVTSLIGSMNFDSTREGILFCLRNDIEAFYSKEDIQEFASRFGNIRKEFTDTSCKTTGKVMEKRREQLVYDKIKYISSFKVVVTDRYHGTIFSAIASTPVVVINSADHKLSSGVDWFSEAQFGVYVQFADSLDEAYDKASSILKRKDLSYNNPPYFKQKYWDKLTNEIN